MLCALYRSCTAVCDVPGAQGRGPRPRPPHHPPRHQAPGGLRLLSSHAFLPAPVPRLPAFPLLRSAASLRTHSRCLPLLQPTRHTPPTSPRGPTSTHPPTHPPALQHPLPPSPSAPHMPPPVTPQNLLLDRRSGCVKVADFGLARTITPPLRPYTHEASGCGLPGVPPLGKGIAFSTGENSITGPNAFFHHLATPAPPTPTHTLFFQVAHAAVPLPCRCLYRRWSPCCTAPPRSCWAPPSTRSRLTSGPWAASWRSWPPASLSSAGTARWVVRVSEHTPNWCAACGLRE